MEENDIRNKTADIHVRCNPEDKMYIEERAKSGFGGKASSQSNLVRYAIRHIDDSSSVDLDRAHELIVAIGNNRPSLAAVHETINDIPQELSAIGNNINQIAKAINTIMKIAREDKESPHETIAKIIAFDNSISSHMDKLCAKIDSYNNTIQDARRIVNNALRKEDEILTRCLVFPTVGGRSTIQAQLLRMLQDSKKDNPQLDFETMTLSKFMDLLKFLTGKKGEPKTK